MIIAVDQHIALAALALHYKELASYHKLKTSRAIARDYLAKVIHLPITLSRPDSADVEKYLNHLWSQTTTAEDKKILETIARAEHVARIKATLARNVSTNNEESIQEGGHLLMIIQKTCMTRIPRKKMMRRKRPLQLYRL